MLTNTVSFSDDCKDCGEKEDYDLVLEQFYEEYQDIYSNKLPDTAHDFQYVIDGVLENAWK